MTPFEKLAKLLRERGIDADSKKQYFLLAGNGLSRLAYRAGTRDHATGISWRSWVSKDFDSLSGDGPTWDYLERDGLTLPEAVAIIDAMKGETGLSDLRSMYHALWELVEQKAEPGPVHQEAVKTFDVIFTTNYDTLFERAAAKQGLSFRRWVLGASQPDEQDHFTTDGHWIDIVKLHGSFPYVRGKARPTPAMFDRWWADDGRKSLVLTSTSYHEGLQKALKLIQSRLFKRKLPQNGEGGVSRLEDEISRAWFVAGHGLSFEDVLVSQVFLQARLDGVIGEDPILSAFAPGAAEQSRQRFKSRAVVVDPGLRSRSASARSDFFVGCFKTLQSGVASSVSPFKHSRVLLVGQVSANHVTRIDGGPIAAERAYTVLKDSQGRPATEYQVGGQALVPALLLDQWDCRPALFSTLGYDADGAEVMRTLMAPDCGIDLRGVVQDRRVVTDHSFVVTYGDVRTLIDSGTSRDTGSHQDIEGRLLGDIERCLGEGAGERRLLYLTKWYLAPVLKRVAQWTQADPKLEVVFETGTAGFADPAEFESCLDQLGPHIDILLSSSLFALRILRPTMNCTDPAEGVACDSLDAASLAEWMMQYQKLEADLARRAGHQALHNHVFAAVLQAHGADAVGQAIRGKLRRRPDGRAGLAVVTLGSAGAVVFPAGAPAYWIEAERIATDTNDCSALGCGDTFRGAFVGSLLSDGDGTAEHTTPASLEQAVRVAVHAGTTKFSRLKLRDALKDLSDYETAKDVASTLRRHDLAAPGTISALACRVPLKT